MIFILLYLHISRGLYYRSFSYSRKSAWITGLLMFLLMMGVAFIGYVLPWGQMSYWGVTVITNLLTAIPYVGTTVQGWLLGGFGPGPTTLTRFYGLHVVLPFVIFALLVLHIALLHKSGSTSGTAIKDPDFIGFHPYFSVKDVYGLAVSLLIFGYLVFFEPNLLGHADNYIPANPLSTPPHIVPEWYFTPFYAILRAFPDKTTGAVAMLLSILILGLIPFVHYWSVFTLQRFLFKLNVPGLQNIKLEVWSLQTTALKWHVVFFWCFFFTFINLIFAGGLPAEDPFILYTRLYTTYYFLYFLVIIPGLPYLDFLLIRLNKLPLTPGISNPKTSTKS
jgi:quinol-cytochrome oxidoreductase complex cytochrome b subunit